MLVEQGLHTTPVLFFRAVLGAQAWALQARDLVRLLIAEKKKKHMERKDDLVGFTAERIMSGGDFTEEEWGAVELKDPGWMGLGKSWGQIRPKCDKWKERREKQDIWSWGTGSSNCSPHTALAPHSISCCQEHYLLPHMAIFEYTGCGRKRLDFL